ncbi:MAG: hypothetical protein ACI9KE_004705 [Polyangiales bacterium]|jgi:hypothetical protein
MPNVSSVSNQPNTFSAGITALTPSAIMHLLRRRMSDMDGQIDSIIGEIEFNTGLSETIQEQVRGLTAIKAAMANQQPDGDVAVKLGAVRVEWEGAEMGADELINLLGISGSVGALRSDENKSIENLEGRAAGGSERQFARQALELGQDATFSTDTVTGSSFQSSIDRLQSEGRSMNSGNEVLMVRMQSAMQQRSQSVTMATQMLKSINDSSNSIAQNIGR